MKEHETKTFKIHDADDETTGKLIKFLYTGDYDVGDGDEGAETTHPDDDGQREAPAAPYLDVDEREELKESQIAEVLGHVSVLNLGDFLQIPSLCQKATDKIIAFLEESWSTKAFAAVLEAVPNEMACSNFHEGLAILAAGRIMELVEDELFAKLTLTNSFSQKALRICAAKIRDQDQERSSVRCKKCRKTIPIG